MTDVVADGALRRVAFVKESTPGTTPSAPGWLTARTITAPYVVDIPWLESQERRADGRLSQDYQGRGTTSVTANLEWSDDGVLDAMLENLLCAAYAGDILRDGVVAQALSAEFMDEIDGGDLYARIRGLQGMSMSMAMAPGEAMTSQFQFIGMDGDYDSAAITGSTYAQPGTEKIFCGTDIGAVQFFGLTVNIAQLSLNIQRTSSARYSLNNALSPFPFSVRRGSLRVSGEAICYLDGVALPQAALAGTEGAVEFTAGVEASKHYSFHMLNARLVGQNIDDGGNTGDNMCRVRFWARHAAGDNSMIKITRNA